MTRHTPAPTRSRKRILSVGTTLLAASKAPPSSIHATMINQEGKFAMQKEAATGVAYLIAARTAPSS